MADYRHEYKYFITKAQQEIIRVRLNGICSLDSHADDSGNYVIRSLYFDDWWDTCYYENEAGTDPREKYRIRIYNGNASDIKLEKKMKIRGMTHKESASLPREMCEILMSGEYPDLEAVRKSGDKMLYSLLMSMKLRSMRPKVIVEYQRMPYVSELGNVRVTFDKMISSSNCFGAFLNEKIASRNILPGGKDILEVKWDEYFPDYMKQILELDALQWTSFSKYYLCRRYNEYGNTRI